MDRIGRFQKRRAASHAILSVLFILSASIYSDRIDGINGISQSSAVRPMISTSGYSSPERDRRWASE